MEKQKVSLVLNVFNEKTVATLKQSKFNDTTLFIEKIMRMWHILNIKSPCEGRNLEDPGRHPINSPANERLNYLERIAASLKLMDNSKKGQRVGGLTVDTANAWHVLLLSLVDLTKSLLGSGMKYICLGKIQSRIEGEFGVIRQLGGGNHLVSVEQVISSLCLRSLKLYHKLHVDTEEMVSNENVCCSGDLSDKDEDIEILDYCFSEAPNLSESERSSLYLCTHTHTKKKQERAEGGGGGGGGMCGKWEGRLFNILNIIAKLNI